LNSASRDVPEAAPRQSLRRLLLERREAFVAGPAFTEAVRSLTRHLSNVLVQLEPASLGIYWPHRSEFNAVEALADTPVTTSAVIALPFAQRTPIQMHYRAWDGGPPTTVDECRIPSSTGVPIVPEVVLVPCVGFTAAGLRLGYGGGYFDRWMAKHPGVTAVGVAWGVAEVDEDALRAEAHDQPLTLVVTESGVRDA
jgi:5-formyltetrahydrofolate cyclo-ligase